MQPKIDRLEQVFKIESTSIFPDALVDEKRRVYFDISKSSLELQHSVLRRAHGRDRFMHADGTLFYAARLLRRHVPREARGRFDEVVKFRQEQASDWLRASDRVRGSVFQ